MYQHPYFKLVLHENDELEAKLQASITERVTLHEWPLSCVERLNTADGRKWIYKSQFGPTLEADFYALTRSSLLVAGEPVFASEDGHVNMLFEFIEGPLLKDLTLSAEDVVRIGQSIIAQIAEIEGQLPYYWDISTESAWAALLETMLDDLGALVSQGLFLAVDEATLGNLKQWAFSQEVLAALAQNVGYVHHDLSGDNVFVLPDGYRVIDWQRPILGPKALDLAALLISLNRDPLPYVGAGVVWIMGMLRIVWFAECARRWFPAGCEVYDKDIARLAASIGQSC